MEWKVNDLYSLGFMPMKNDRSHWVFKNKLYYIEENLHFYEIVEDINIKLSDVPKYNNFLFINGYILKLVDVLKIDNYIQKIQKYIRVDKISKLLLPNCSVPKCPTCGHNFYEGGYGVCKWCIDEFGK